MFKALDLYIWISRFSSRHEHKKFKVMYGLNRYIQTKGIMSEGPRPPHYQAITKTENHQPQQQQQQQHCQARIRQHCQDNIRQHQDQKRWLRTVLDNTQHEEVIARETQERTEFDPNLPSLYRRELNLEFCIGLNTAFGRKLLASTLYHGPYGNIYTTLSMQFLTQAESLLCGPSTLVVVLNALGVDPGREWKYPWRWYDEKVLNKCVPCQHTAYNGCSMDVLMCMAKCNGLSVEAVRASLEWSEEDFREDVKLSCSSLDKPMILNFSRQVLQQSGTGHFSPVGAYNEEHDMVLVMDTARFKYPPFWTKLETLWKALQHTAVGLDNVSSGMPRGYMILSKAEGNQNASTHIRLPWQQARVKIKTLSNDRETLYTLYLLKKFKHSWCEWLDQPVMDSSTRTLKNDTNMTIEDDTFLAEAVEKIIDFSQKTDVAKHMNNKKERLPEKINFNLAGIQKTLTYENVRRKLSAVCPTTEFQAVECFLQVVLKLIEIDEKSDREKENTTIVNCLSQNISYTDNSPVISEDRLDKVASLLSIIFVFWPYSMDRADVPLTTVSNRSAIRKTVQTDVGTYPEHFSRSVQEQISFVLKTIDHVGHEEIYRKEVLPIDT